jgi:hypothetical protein
VAAGAAEASAGGVAAGAAAGAAAAGGVAESAGAAASLGLQAATETSAIAAEATIIVRIMWASLLTYEAPPSPFFYGTNR